MWRGDTDSGCRIAGSFTTVASTGAPSSLTGTPAPTLIAYRLNPNDATGFTCSTAGVTLARDCNGRTGWNAWSVNTGSDLTFYSCASDFELVVTGGTISGVCSSGYVVASWSIKNRSGLRPTVPGRTVDIDTSGRVLTQPCSTTFSVQSVLNAVPAVSGSVGSISGVTFPTNFGATHITSGGEVGINWGRVANCGTVQNMVCTSLFRVTSVLNNVPGVTGNVGGNVVGSVGSVTAAVSIDPCSTTYRVETLGTCAVNQILDGTVTQPSAVYSWPATVRQVLGYRGALDTNCITQTASVQSVCTRAASATIASYPITCTSTIVHRGSAT